MREFFRVRKRKAGVVTLVVACMTMGGWLRSQSVLDRLHYGIAGRQFQICSFRGRVRWITGIPKVGFPLLTGRDALAISPAAPVPDDAVYFINAGNWEQVYELKFPYLPIVLPLTALSAWLLLSKPRSQDRSKPATTTSN